MVKKTLPFCLFSENTNTKKHFYNLAHSRKFIIEKSSSKVSTPSCNISKQILCKKVECTNKEKKAERKKTMLVIISILFSN